MTVPYHTTFPDVQEINPPFKNVESYPSRELAKGETLYYFGDEAEAVFRVEEGLFKLSVDIFTGRERIINVAGPNDLIGAISPIHNTYQDTAEALSPTVKISSIPKPFIKTNNELQRTVHVAAGIQLVRVREALEDTELPVNARLARTLLRLGQRFGNTSNNGYTHLTLPLTHENLASMIGAARETTTAILGELRQMGLINGTRGHYGFNYHNLSEFAVKASL